MKSTIIAIVLLVASAQTQRVEFFNINGALSAIQNSTDDLAAVVKTFDGNLQPVFEASNTLITIVNNGTTIVDDSRSLAYSDVVKLRPQVHGLKDHAQILSDDLLAKRSEIQKAKGCDFTRVQIQNVKNASNVLIEALINKIVPVLKGLAKKEAQGFTEILQKTEDDFSGSNCVDA